MIKIFKWRIYSQIDIDEAKADGWSEGWADAHNRIQQDSKEALKEFANRPRYSEVNIEYTKPEVTLIDTSRKHIDNDATDGTD